MTWKAIILTFFLLGVLAFGIEHPWVVAGFSAGIIACMFLLAFHPRRR